LTVYLAKWFPFDFACRLRSLQQGALNVGNDQQNRLSLLAAAIVNANGAATWAKWRVGNASRTSHAALRILVTSVPGFVAPLF
jgi:hypothetical protein